MSLLYMLYLLPGPSRLLQRPWPIIGNGWKASRLATRAALSLVCWLCTGTGELSELRCVQLTENIKISIFFFLCLKISPHTTHPRLCLNLYNFRDKAKVKEVEIKLVPKQFPHIISHWIQAKER